MATLKVTNIKNESFAGDQLYLKTDGKIGIGTTSPLGRIHVHQTDSGTVDGLIITNTSTSNNGLSIGVSSSEEAFFWNGSDTSMNFATNNQERIRIDNNGRTIIGHSSSMSEGCLLQVARANDNTVEFFGFSANSNGARINLTKSRNATIGANTIVHDDDTIGELHFRAANGTAYFRVAAIEAEMDGSISASSLPGRLIFSTTASGATTQTERMRIKSDGDIEVGGNLKTNNLSGRNLVINGAMQVSQRGTSFSGSATPEYTLDRFRQANGSSWNFDTTTTQESAGPDGFSKSLKITPDTTDTPTAGENGVIDYFIEGQDLQNLAFGTSSAKKVTVSFYAKSSAQNNNHQYTLQMWHKNSGTSQFNINKAFTVTSTWQRFIITFPADTSNNMLDGSSQWAGRLTWILSSGPDDIASEVSTWTSGNLYKAVTGQSNFMDNTSNEFHLTGVQLEIGSIATEFDHKSYAEELSRCQRYFYRFVSGASQALGLGVNYTATEVHCAITFPVTMRTTPTLSSASGTNYYEFIRDGAADWFNSFSLGNRTTNKIAELYNASEISGTIGHGGFIRTDNAAVYVDFLAEF